MFQQPRFLGLGFGLSGLGGCSVSNPHPVFEIDDVFVGLVVVGLASLRHLRCHLVVEEAEGGAPSTILNILFRDTLLLTPQASRSLKEIGKLVGQEKLQLDPDEAKHKDMIRNMDRVRVENWAVFKQYALNDATICVRYIEKIIAQFEEVTGKNKVPVTLTSIGVELLQKSWKDNFAAKPLTILGKEEVTSPDNRPYLTDSIAISASAIKKGLTPKQSRYMIWCGGTSVNKLLLKSTDLQNYRLCGMGKHY